MKLLLVFLAVTGLAASAPTKDLTSDIEEILATLPIQEIADIIRRYAVEDAEVREIVRYMQSEEWANLVAAVENHPIFQEFLQYLQENDFDLGYYIQIIRDFINSLDVGAGRGTRTLRDLLDEIIAIIDLDAFLTELSDKLENSEDIQNLYEVISSQDAYEFVEQIRYLEEVQRIADILRDWGVNVDRVLEVIYAFLGWN